MPTVSTAALFPIEEGSPLRKLYDDAERSGYDSIDHREVADAMRGLDFRDHMETLCAWKRNAKQAIALEEQAKREAMVVVEAARENIAKIEESIADTDQMLMSGLNASPDMKFAGRRFRCHRGRSRTLRAEVRCDNDGTEHDGPHPQDAECIHPAPTERVPEEFVRRSIDSDKTQRFHKEYRDYLAACKKERTEPTWSLPDFLTETEKEFPVVNLVARKPKS